MARSPDPRASGGRREGEPGPNQRSRFRMPSRREAVARAVERIVRAAKAARLTGEQRDNLAVAVAEALSNAAVHGNKLRPGASVEVSLAVAPDSFTVEVRDQGSGFDAGEVADPTEPGRLLVPGGRGVFLMRQLVDEIHYNERGNSVRLVVRRGPAAR